VTVSLSGRLSVRMEQLGFPWMELYEICYLNVFRECIENIQVL